MDQGDDDETNRHVRQALLVGDPVRQWRLSAAVYGVGAAIVMLATRPRLGREAVSQTAAVGMGHTRELVGGK
jgi:hypothetical protein